MENLKVGDLVVCNLLANREYRTGIGYGKVLKLYELRTQREYQEYGPIITGKGNANSKLEVTVQMLGYDLRDGDNEDDLGELVEINEVKVMDPHCVYRIITEEEINRIRNKWEVLMINKLNFLYKNVNKPVLEGRKSLNKLKIKS